MGKALEMRDHTGQRLKVKISDRCIHGVKYTSVDVTYNKNGIDNVI